MKIHIYCAQEEKIRDICQEIRKRGIKVINSQSHAKKLTPLHCAAISGRLNVVKLLFTLAREYGHRINIYAQDIEGDTVLHAAAGALLLDARSKQQLYLDIIKLILIAEAELKSNNHVAYKKQLYLKNIRNNLRVGPFDLLRNDNELRSKIKDIIAEIKRETRPNKVQGSNYHGGQSQNNTELDTGTRSKNFYVKNNKTVPLLFKTPTTQDPLEEKKPLLAPGTRSCYENR